MIAINPRNQSLVNKACSWLVKHNAFNTQRDEAYNNDNIVKAVQLSKKCEHTFDKYLEYCDELPVREVAAIEKSELY